MMDSKKMWRSNYAPPLLCILWRLGIRLPPLPFMGSPQNSEKIVR
ncbi:TPA: DUF6404 family protein [Escherichia coli]